MNEAPSVFEFSDGNDRDVFEVQRVNEKFISKNLKPGTLFCFAEPVYPTLCEFETFNKFLLQNDMSFVKTEPINFMHTVWSAGHLPLQSKIFENMKKNDWLLLLEPNIKTLWLESLDGKKRKEYNFHAVTEYVAGIRFYTILTKEQKKAYAFYTTYSNRYLHEEIIVSE